MKDFCIFALILSIRELSFPAGQSVYTKLTALLKHCWCQLWHRQFFTFPRDLSVTVLWCSGKDKGLNVWSNNHKCAPSNPPLASPELARAEAGMPDAALPLGHPTHWPQGQFPGIGTRLTRNTAVHPDFTPHFHANVSGSQPCAASPGEQFCRVASEPSTHGNYGKANWLPDLLCLLEPSPPEHEYIGIPSFLYTHIHIYI